MCEEWPLDNVTEFSYEGKVFSFEAGRKYAFSAKRASQLFHMVARNINGELLWRATHLICTHRQPHGVVCVTVLGKHTHTH